MSRPEALTERPDTRDTTQSGPFDSLVPALLSEVRPISTMASSAVAALPDLSHLLEQTAKVGKDGATYIADTLRSPLANLDAKKSGKIVDTVMEQLKKIGLDENTGKAIGAVLKKLLACAEQIKSVDFTMKDGKPGLKIEFKSPVSIPPLSLGEKGPLEFSLSPTADGKGLEFSGIKGAKVGMGPLKVDVTDASLKLDKHGDPTLTLNKIVALPLGTLLRALRK